jgi:hypothetical protein
MKQHSVRLPKYVDRKVNLPRVPFLSRAAISKTTQINSNSISKMAYAVTFLPSVREAPGLSFGGNTYYPEVIRGFL